MKTLNIMTAAVVSAAFLIGFGFSPDASAKPKPKTKTQCDVTVTGSGADPSDATAIATAVNSAGLPATATVCLNGTFGFGTDSFVAINPLASVQELNIVGINGATIQGGNQPMRFPPESTLPRLSIKNIRFEEPAGVAVTIFGSNEQVVVSGLDIDGVLRLELAPGFFIRQGIAFTALADIEGRIEVTDSTIDGGSYTADDLAQVNAGIALFGTFGFVPTTILATVVVANNDIRNWSGSGIGAISLTGATIEHNTIAPGAFANASSAGTCTGASTGLGAAAGISLAGVVDSLIKSNTIELSAAQTGDGNAACNAGIILIGNAGAARDSTGNTFKGNKVRGTGSYALFVGLDTSAAEEDNLFQGNNVSTFGSTEASLFLGPAANGNTFKGHFPTLEGNISGNSITGP